MTHKNIHILFLNESEFWVKKKEFNNLVTCYHLVTLFPLTAIQM